VLFGPLVGEKDDGAFVGGAGFIEAVGGSLIGLLREGEGLVPL
jgi:hypothetical protein